MRKMLLPIVGVVVAGLFALGIARLFLIRFESGDVYPPYSSLRSDPLGTRIFLESLAAIHGMTVCRNYESVDSLDLDPHSAILFLGDTIQSGERLPRQTVDRIDTFVRKGGRLVFAFLPRNQGAPAEKIAPKPIQPPAKVKAKKEKPEKKEEPKEPKGPKKKPPWTPPDKTSENFITVEEWLGLAVCDSPITNEAAATLHAGLADTDLPACVSCHTSLFFTNVVLEARAAARTNEPWRVVYERDGRPVILERRSGIGTLVLSALSYFVSNEAMKDERHSSLLAWLVGPKCVVIFDESHLGIQPSSGVAALLREYRLQWVGAALLLLVGLVVWQSSTSLVPPARTRPGAEEIAEGKHSEAGLVNLLRRNLPPAALLRVALDEWRKSAASSEYGMEQKIRLMEAVLRQEEALPKGRHDPVATYNALCRIRNDRKSPADRRAETPPPSGPAAGSAPAAAADSALTLNNKENV